MQNPAGYRIRGTWVSPKGEPEVWAEEEWRMPDGSEFQIAWAAPKPQEAKVVIVDNRLSDLTQTQTVRTFTIDKHTQTENKIPRKYTRLHQRFMFAVNRMLQ